MDPAGLTILLRELGADCEVARAAAAHAGERARIDSPGHLEACAYELTLRANRLTELAAAADRLAQELPAWCAEFEKKVRAEQGW